MPLRGHGYGRHWGPGGGAVMEIAGTTQRGAAPWCGDQDGPQVDLLGAQRWHGHGDHGGRAQLWRSLWHPEVVQS